MTKLYAYQEKGVELIDQFGGRALLADDMGLGKTIQSLWWARHHMPKGSTIVVVCPASVKWNWQREAAAHVNMRAEILSGLNPPVDSLREGCIYIVNYDILSGGRKKQKHRWLDLLRELQPDLVIVDECHYIKTMTAKRTKAVQSLCRIAPHVIMISGTPLTNRPAELFPAVNILCPEDFPSFRQYAWRYCNPKRTHWGWDLRGAANLDELHQRLTDCCMIRRRKADVLKDLPAKTRTVVPMELSSADASEYRKAEREFLIWLRKISPQKARSASMAEYLVKRGYLKRLAGMLKQRQVISWLEDFLEQTDEKLIFFGVHKKFLKPIYLHFKHLAVHVDGNVTGMKRQVAFDLFTKNKSKRLLVGNIHAAGCGWNGQVANHVAFGELDWVPGTHTQAEDRTHRIGQTRGVMCHYLVSKGTIEEKLCSILQEKQKILSEILDGHNNVELDIMLKLEKMLLEDGKKRIKK